MEDEHHEEEEEEDDDEEAAASRRAGQRSKQGRAVKPDPDAPEQPAGGSAQRGGSAGGRRQQQQQQQGGGGGGGSSRGITISSAEQRAFAEKVTEARRSAEALWQGQTGKISQQEMDNLTRVVGAACWWHTSHTGGGVVRCLLWWRLRCRSRVMVRACWACWHHCCTR